MHRIAGLRGIPVAFACDTELVYDEKADRYELFVTRHEAKLDGNETTQHVDRLPPLESRVSLGTPELIVVAEGGGRAMMKSQGILERHGIEIQLKSVTKLFASALTRHPTPSELVNQSSVLGETHYFATPGQFPESVSIVSGNVITRAPKYLAMEKEGKEVPPDTWYIRLPPNDDLQLERLSFSVNPQDFGITEYAPSAAMTNYVTTRVGRMLGHLSSPEIAAKAEIIKIARPFPQTDTVLSSCAFANVAIFGDAARTGSFLSGMGMNSLMCLNSNSLLAIAKTARDGKLSAAAREEYTASIQKATKEWHKMTRVIQTEALPPWIPDLEVTSAAESKKEAPRTLLKFGKIETLGRYAIANLILNYLVPIKFLRVGLRRVGEWVVGGVERRDEARASL